MEIRGTIDIALKKAFDKGGQIILKNLDKSGLWKEDKVTVDMTDIRSQLHADILKWVEEKMPKADFSKCEDSHDRAMNDGYNLYRQQALKNLGIKEGEGTNPPIKRKEKG